MLETRRMHYVPRTYLKYFSTERKGDYFIDALNKETGTIFSPNINNICVEKDIYALPGETVEARQFLETMYGKLYECEYDDIYKVLMDPDKEFLTPSERYSIISFVVSMFYRNNSWNNFHNKFMDGVYERAFYTTQASGHDSFFLGDEEISIAGKSLEALQKENRKNVQPAIALSTAQHIFKLTRLRMVNDVVTVVKVDGSYEFITSDNPVSAKGEDSKLHLIPMDPTNTLTMPINKHHLLLLRPWGHQLDKLMLGRMTENLTMGLLSVVSNNEYQKRQSDKFILGTKNGLIKSLEDPDDVIRNHFAKLKS